MAVDNAKGDRYQDSAEGKNLTITSFTVVVPYNSQVFLPPMSSCRMFQNIPNISLKLSTLAQR